MIKRARLFAATLVLAGAFGVPERADAMPMLLCSVAFNVVSNTIAGSPAYDYWSTYWLRNCDN